MKKITLMFLLFIATLGFSQSLPFDFSSSDQLFTGDGNPAPVVSIVQDSGNDVLQIIGAATNGQWDNAQIVFAAPLDLSDDANNTITIKIKAVNGTGTGKHLLKFEGGLAGPANAQIYFDAEDNTDWQTFTLNFPANLGNFSKIVLFTDAGDSGATTADTYLVDDISIGADPAATCTDGIQNGDETGIDCGGSSCATCPEITLPLDFSDASQLFTHVGAGAGGSVVMEGGQMRFNGNGQAYDQAYLDLTETFSLMDNANNTFTVTMNPIGVPDGEERTHLIRASFAGGSAAGTQIKGKSIGSGSQDVAFNFPVSGAEAWSQIILFMDFGRQGASTDYNDIVTNYLISSITLGADPVQVPPTGAAPTPPARNAADVISIYSKTTDAVSVYADIAGVSFPAWGPGSGNVTPEAFENDLALKLPAYTFQGVTFAETDLSGMTMLHLDIWAQLEDVGLDLIPTAGGAKRVNITSNSGEWSSVDIALSDFTDLNLSQIFQMKFYGFDGANADGSLDIYLDNIYFYTGFPLSTDKNNIVNVSLYPNPAKGSLNISAKNTIENATIYNVLGKKIKSFTVNAKTSSLDVSGLSRGIYILKYTANNAVGSMKFVKE